jgi:SAM-dependent methyltransferase
VDVGTFVGHDLRRLAFDGAPTDKLYGVDIVSYRDVSYDLFRDRDHFKGHFIEADFLSTTSPELMALKGKVDIIVVSQLLHQWTWDGQVKAAQALVSFTKPGSLIVGNQIGNSEGQEITLKAPPVSLWRHDTESFSKMFNEAVGPATGTTWETQAWLRSFADMGWDEQDAAWMEPNVCLIEFVARRLS